MRWRLAQMATPWLVPALTRLCGCGRWTSTKQSSGSALPLRTSSPPRSGKNTFQRIYLIAHRANYELIIDQQLYHELTAPAKSDFSWSAVVRWVGVGPMRDVGG